ncbi:MAG: hypothetical protein ACJ73D_06965 [Pyrinomonadaceae bacterium]
MPSKYDTNPLDPDFPEKVRRENEGTPTQVLSEAGPAETRHFPPSAPTEDQTVRLPGGSQSYAPPPPPPPYQQPYTGQYVPAMYGSQRFGAQVERKVPPFGVSENVVTAAPYIPWYIGLIAGVIILYMSSRSETKARFHAAQGVAAHIVILLISAMLGAIGAVSGAARAGSLAFGIAMSIMLIVWAIKAWKGKPVHIQALDPLTNWLEDKIRQKDK